MNKKVKILLSTYNGEKHLREQLDSLLNQTYSNIEILIRDDGSKDTTSSILKEYAKKNKRITVLYEKNIGVKESFFHLMKVARNTADFYAFCDQDDIWLPNKIERAVNQLVKEPKDSYSLYCTALNLVDENMNLLRATKEFIPGKENAMIQNIVTGCTTVITNSLLNLLIDRQPDMQNIEMHDSWMYLIASFLGNVIFDKSPTINYRQHSNNEVGMPSNKYQDLKNALYSAKLEREKKVHRKQLVEFLKKYNDILDQADLKTIHQFLEHENNVFIRYKKLREMKIYKQSWIKTAAFHILYIFNQV